MAVNTSTVKSFDAIASSSALLKVGMVGGVRVDYTKSDVTRLEQRAIELGITRAYNDKISSSMNGLIVRDIIPNLDFVDQNGSGINRRWRWPASGGYTNAETNLTVWQTNQSVNNDKKVYVFYGARQVDPGTGRTGTNTNTTTVEFDFSSYIVDIWTLDHIDSSQDTTVLANTPIVFGKSQNMIMKVYPKTTGSGSFDCIMLLGKVIEPRGNTLQGQQGVLPI